MNSNFETPKSLNNSYSEKGATMTTLEGIVHVLKTKYNTDYQIVLLTSYGMIKCDIDSVDSSEDVFLPTDEENKFTFNLKCLTAQRNNIINSMEADNPDLQLRDDGTFLHLKNATIYSNGMSSSMVNPSATFADFVIFVDQIIGFSLIPRTADE